MNVFELYHEDIYTSLLFCGMSLTMLVGFPMIFLRLKKGYRMIFVGHAFFHCISFYFLFSACLPTRMKKLNIYWNIYPEIHLGLFGVTWFLSICCLVGLIYQLTKHSK